jgi:deoxyadenosine/deoxycytidine kinase
MYICIEGNIGAGKTTLAIALAKRRGGNFLAEQFEDNPLLPLFYGNKERMAFVLEYSFLISRHTQLNKHFASKKRKVTIADFSLHKCLWFAKSNLNKKEFEFYKKHFKIIESVAESPDLLIYINTQPKNLLQNIKKRGRDYEKSIDKKYLQKVSKNYTAGIKKIKGMPVIEFYVNKYDAKTNETIVNRIDEILKKGIKFKYKKIVL